MKQFIGIFLALTFTLASTSLFARSPVENTDDDDAEEVSVEDKADDQDADHPKSAPLRAPAQTGNSAVILIPNSVDNRSNYYQVQTEHAHCISVISGSGTSISCVPRESKSLKPEK